MDDRLRYSPWFFAAWVLLVVVVAFGFWRQARIIDELEHQRDVIKAVVCEVAPLDILHEHNVNCERG